MEEGACNYDPDALFSDGSCLQLDECGECGGDGSSCAEIFGCTDSTACNYNPDANNDDGSCLLLDECNVCGGAGIAEGACDCAGTMPACGYDCDGVCILDEDNDGICDCEDECVPAAAAQMLTDEYKLTVEAYNVGALGTTYRFYVNAEDETDKLSAVFGNDQANLVINTPENIYNDAFNSSWNASGINPALLPVFPDLAFDSFATIGLDGPAAGVPGAEDPSLVQDATMSPSVSDYFLTGGTGLNVTTLTGASWYALNTAANTLPTDGRWLIAQITTTGSISGTFNYQIFPLGVGADQVQKSVDFDGEGEFPESATVTVCGCMDQTACNYNPEANNEDGSCLQLDECGECGGSGIAPGACDCDGNVFDQCGECGGDGAVCSGCMEEGACNYDPDALFSDGSCLQLDECGECGGDGIADGACDCEGNVLDECGECGGEGIPEGACDCDGNVLDECGECGGSGIPEGECDCDGNVLDECGVCDGDGYLGCTNPEACNYDAEACGDDGSCDVPFPDCQECVDGVSTPIDSNDDGINDCEEVPGCTDSTACNYNEAANASDGSCEYAADYYDCAGSCLNDTDGDEICDELEVAGCQDEMACNYNVEATDAGDCDYAEEGFDCDGNCVIGEDCNGVCGGSDVLDECGVCGGDNSDCLDDCGVPNGDNSSCADDCGVPYGDNSSCSDDCGVPFGDNTTCVVGCLDESACNYNPEATVESSNGVNPSTADLILTISQEYDDDGNLVTENFYVIGQAIYDEDGLGSTGTPDMGVLWLSDSLALIGGVFPALWSSDGVFTVAVPEEPEDVDGFELGLSEEQLLALFENIGETLPIHECEILDSEEPCLLEYEGFSWTYASGSWTGELPDVVDSWTCSYIAEGACDCDGNVLDECGVCNGPGDIYECGCADIPVGDCDCNGNQLDAFGVCGGDCPADLNNNGICDTEEECAGSEDECNVCFGPGAIYECGCSDIPEGDCDCDGNQLDALGVCGGPCEADVDGDGVCDVDEIFGCTDLEACNYDPEVTEDDGSCAEVDECGVCGGIGIAPGECDCDGNVLDECGVCGGEGAVFECGCADIPEGDCDCDGNVLDECGVCGGEGAVFECGCADIPEGDCDCDGNVLDECGICGGTGIPEGDCDCDGNVLDALGVCGGPCEADDNGNGLCDADEVPGCLDINNPLYNPNANVDDGSCLVGGCTFEEACNYDELAEFQELGSCDFESCAGCGDAQACNFDADAQIADDTLCTYPEAFVDCDGACLNDADGDGVCDELEVLGCTDPLNPGYNQNATEDDGSCFVGGCLLEFACNYDPDADFVDLSTCEFDECVGCMDATACNFDPDATLNSQGSCTFPLNQFLDCNGVCNNDADGDGICDEFEIPGCMDVAAINFNPFATEDDGSCLVLTGGCVIPFACNYDPNADYYDGSCDFQCLYGTAEMGCNHEMACNYGATDEPCLFFNAEGQTCIPGGCLVESACNYDNDAMYSDGSCDFDSCVSPGCTLEGACNFNPAANTNDGSCDFDSCTVVISGCTNPLACNFEGMANADNGTCEFVSCLSSGCTMPNACNYDVNASILDDSCEYPQEGLDCTGQCVNDADSDGVCDLFEIPGCTDAVAVNFNMDATDNNGTCVYANGGCTDMLSCNFSHLATEDDGSCEYGCLGCMSIFACNFDPEATLHDPSACEFLLDLEITGAMSVAVGEEEVYSITGTSGTSIQWHVQGGNLVAGQHTESVIVVWTASKGVIEVTEITTAGCEGETFILEVESIVSGMTSEGVAFAMYPNPANDQVVFEMPGTHSASLRIQDATGREVYSMDNLQSRHVVSTADLANGMYQVVVTTGGKKEIKSLVIAH
jgi:hypothetical protein